MAGLRGWAALTAVVVALAGSASAQPACGRACLVGSMDRYLAALAAHDPGRLKVTPDVRFTEDGAPMKLGDGLWQTIGAPSSVKRTSGAALSRPGSCAASVAR